MTNRQRNGRTQTEYTGEANEDNQLRRRKTRQRLEVKQDQTQGVKDFKIKLNRNQDHNNVRSMLQENVGRKFHWTVKMVTSAGKLLVLHLYGRIKSTMKLLVGIQSGFNAFSFIKFKQADEHIIKTDHFYTVCNF